MPKRDGDESRKKQVYGAWLNPKRLQEWAISREAPNRRTFNDYLVMRVWTSVPKWWASKFG